MMPARLLAALISVFLFSSCSDDPPGAPTVDGGGAEPMVANQERARSVPVALAGEGGNIAAFDGPDVRGATMGYATLNVYITALDGALAVSWDVVQETETYRIRVAVLDSGAVVTEKIVAAPTMSTTVGPLANGVDYYITVTAVHSTGFEMAAGVGTAAPVGAADDSTPTPTTPAPSGVPGQVTGVSVYPQDGALRVVWSAVAGRVSQYRADANAPDGTLARRAYTGGDTSVTLDRLTNGVEYGVTVRATNGGDWGPASAAAGTPRGVRYHHTPLSQVPVMDGGPVCFVYDATAYGWGYDSHSWPNPKGSVWTLHLYRPPTREFPWPHTAYGQNPGSVVLPRVRGCGLDVGFTYLPSISAPPPAPYSMAYNLSSIEIQTGRAKVYVGLSQLPAHRSFTMIVFAQGNSYQAVFPLNKREEVLNVYGNGAFSYHYSSPYRGNVGLQAVLGTVRNFRVVLVDNEVCGLDMSNLTYTRC